jgi:two-component system chemotaxis response regulator CheY
MTAIVAKLLIRCGFTDVDQAASGAQALDELKKHRYGLLVADVNMAGMSGVELLARVRGDIMYHDVCVVLMTAMRDRGLVEAAVCHNADCVILKPFTSVALKEKLARIPKMQAA